ncbi:hypothetical protein M8C21_017436, partial [Ambrosia artemisiifolia]
GHFCPGFPWVQNLSFHQQHPTSTSHHITRLILHRQTRHNRTTQPLSPLLKTTAVDFYPLPATPSLRRAKDRHHRTSTTFGPQPLSNPPRHRNRTRSKSLALASTRYRQTEIKGIPIPQYSSLGIAIEVYMDLSRSAKNPYLKTSMKLHQPSNFPTQMSEEWIQIAFEVH